MRQEENRYYHRWLGRDPHTQTLLTYGVYSETWWNANEDEYRLMVVTHPDHRNNGYASQFYEFTLSNLASDRGKISQLRTGTHEDQTQSISFLENRGFELKDRYPRSELDLTDYNNHLLPKYQARMAEHGIKICSLADLIPIDDQWQHKLHELDWVLVQDEPTDDPAKKMPFEEYVPVSYTHLTLPTKRIV